jgi:hypothetical protein
MYYGLQADTPTFEARFDELDAQEICRREKADQAIIALPLEEYSAPTNLGLEQ